MNKYSPLVSEFESAEQEAAYDEWLRAKVVEAIADPRPSVPHDEAVARIDAAIARGKARANKC